MGTYSEVVFVCKKNVNDLIQKEQETNEDLSNFLNFADIKNTEEQNQEKVFLYYWENIKWYGSYPEVSFMNDLAKQHEEDCYLVEVVETGEEFVSGGYMDNPFDVWVERSIHFVSGGYMDNPFDVWVERSIHFDTST